MTRGPTKREFFATELAEYERQWLAGYFPALIDAFNLCTANRRHLPAWLASAVQGELLKTFLNGGKGKGRTSRHLQAAVTADVHQMRWSVATMTLRGRRELPAYGLPANRDGAFERASQMLAGAPARGEKDAVRDSYERVERAKKRRPK